MNFGNGFTDLQIQLEKMAFLWMVLEAVSFVIGLWIAYLVIKAAVRDGIKESGLIKSRWQQPTWEETVRAQETKFPDIRADRDETRMGDSTKG